jgi:hypothetical protein
MKKGMGINNILILMNKIIYSIYVSHSLCPPKIMAMVKSYFTFKDAFLRESNVKFKSPI